MAQVRLVQIGTAQPGTAIQIGKTGALLAAQISQPLQGVPAAANIQLGKFNNQTGTFYKDPSGALAAGPIQVGTHLANKTLGYIVGTGAPTTSVIATQTAPGAGYFSIWNAGAVQGGFQIQVPNCTGQQAKATGSQSNQPAVQSNQPLLNQPLNQQAPSYYAGKQQPLVQQAPNYYAGKQQPLVQQAPSYYAGPTVPGGYVPPAGNNFGYSPGYYYPPYQTPQQYYAGKSQPLNQQAPNYYAGFSQPLNQQAPSYYAGVQQPLVQQPLNQVNQPLIITPSTNQAATGALYNGSWVNTAPGTGQNAGGFVLTIPNIGTLTTQGGAFSGTGAGGSFQAPSTYTRTASAAVSTQQGIVNFQTTTRN